MENVRLCFVQCYLAGASPDNTRLQTALNDKSLWLLKVKCLFQLNQSRCVDCVHWHIEMLSSTNSANTVCYRTMDYAETL